MYDGMPCHVVTVEPLRWQTGPYKIAGDRFRRWWLSRHKLSNFRNNIMPESAENFLEMAWPLVKFGISDNNIWNGDDDYHSTDDNPLILHMHGSGSDTRPCCYTATAMHLSALSRCQILSPETGELVVRHGENFLDVLNLIADPTQIKGSAKGAVLCVYVRHGECWRKFRFKFAPSDGIEDFQNCFNVVKILKKIFYIVYVEEEEDTTINDTANVLDEQEDFVDIRPISRTSENSFNTPGAESYLLPSSTSDLEAQIMATLLDPALYDICNQIDNVINLW